jgi:hypothetical protein
MADWNVPAVSLLSGLTMCPRILKRERMQVVIDGDRKLMQDLKQDRPRGSEIDAQEALV